MGIADRFQSWNRQRKADWIERFIRERDICSVLVVGVGGRPRFEWEALIEHRIADVAETVVWSGIGSAEFPLRPLVLADGRRLPFTDQAFDLVYSNAVIEHVGDVDDQEAFIAEHRRVGRSWVATTPNRWFPVEAHTRTVLRHWSSDWRAGRTEFTRLLSRSEFATLCDHVDGGQLAPTLTGWG